MISLAARWFVPGATSLHKRPPRAGLKQLAGRWHPPPISSRGTDRQPDLVSKELPAPPSHRATIRTRLWTSFTLSRMECTVFWATSTASLCDTPPSFREMRHVVAQGFKLRLPGVTTNAPRRFRPRQWRTAGALSGSSAWRHRVSDSLKRTGLP